MAEESKEKDKPKKPRRPKGDGSVQKMPNGKYKIQITIGYDANKRQRKKSFTGNTEKEAISALTKFKIEKSKGTLVVSNKYTVSEFIQRWLSNKKSELKETTYSNYVNVCNKHLIPKLGSTRIQKLTTAKINDYFTACIKEGLSQVSLRKHKSMIHDVLELAINENVIGANCAIRSNSLKSSTRKMNVLSTDEIKKLLDKAKELLDVKRKRLRLAYYIILLTLATGLRLGELLGLQKEDIDMDRNTISVRHNLTRVNRQFKLDTPKTKSSWRTISVDPQVLKIIKEIFTDNSYVFHTVKGDPLSPSNTSSLFQEVLAMANIKDVRFHDLRHTHATQLIASGCSIKMVSERLGHSNVNITLSLYVHSLPEQDHEAAKIMGKMLLG